MRFSETSRDRRLAFWDLVLGSTPGDLGHDFPSQASVNSPFRPRLRIPPRGQRKGAHPVPCIECGSRELGGGGWGQEGVVCYGRAPLSLADRRRSLSSSLPSLDGGAPLLWLPSDQHAAPSLETAGPRLSARTKPWLQSRPLPPITSYWCQTLAPPRSNCARGHIGSEVPAGRETTSWSQRLVREEAGSAA